VKAQAPKAPVTPRRTNGPVTQQAVAPAAAPTVEIIRGDKRTAEVIK
jgi:hypothetical protein